MLAPKTLRCGWRAARRPTRGDAVEEALGGGGLHPGLGGGAAGLGARALLGDDGVPQDLVQRGDHNLVVLRAAGGTRGLGEVT